MTLLCRPCSRRYPCEPWCACYRGLVVWDRLPLAEALEAIRELRASREADAAEAVCLGLYVLRGAR